MRCCCHGHVCLLAPAAACSCCKAFHANRDVLLLLLLLPVLLPRVCLQHLPVVALLFLSGAAAAAAAAALALPAAAILAAACRQRCLVSGTHVRMEHI
jgi:hypothetical protein